MSAVLEKHPEEGVTTLPGYVWLAMRSKLRHVPEWLLEFREEA